MPPRHGKKKERITEATYVGEFQTLRIRNLKWNTSPRSLLAFFGWRFQVADVRVELLFGHDLSGTEAFLTIPARDAAQAIRWAHGRQWRGKKLNVSLERDSAL